MFAGQSSVAVLLSLLLFSSRTHEYQHDLEKLRPGYVPESDFSATETLTNVITDLVCSVRARVKGALIFHYKSDEKECLLGNVTSLANLSYQPQDGYIKLYLKDNPFPKVGLMFGHRDEGTLAYGGWHVLLPNGKVCAPTDIPLPRRSGLPGFAFHKGILYHCHGSYTKWFAEISEY